MRKSSIIGVTPLEFFGLEVGSSLDISIPLMMQQQTMPGIESYAGSDSGRPVITVMDRLRLGVTMPQAQAGLNVLYQQLVAEYAAEGANGVANPGSKRSWYWNQESCFRIDAEVRGSLEADILQ